MGEVIKYLSTPSVSPSRVTWEGFVRVGEGGGG